MALSFGDIALSIGAGIAEKDMQYMQEKEMQILI